MITENTSTSVDFSRKGVWPEIQDYLMIAIGTGLYCAGVAMFMLPYKLTTGGVAGIASIIFYATGIEVQISYFAINCLFLLFAIKILGWRFCIKTIAGVCFATFWMWFWQRVIENPDGSLPQICGDQIFMACIIGPMMAGFGLSICFYHNGSMGGTDIVAACINKFKDISLGQVILACDIAIISSCYFIFHDIERVVFGYVMMAVCAITLDYCTRRQHQAVKFEIYSRNYAGIADAITHAGFGVTVMDGLGWWTKSERKVVVCVASKRYESIIARCIKQVDPYAFIDIINVEGVYGEGFSTMKTKVKNQKPIIVVASTNPVFLQEIKKSLGDTHDVRTLSDIGCSSELPSSSISAEDDARVKARYVNKFYGFSTVSYSCNTDGSAVISLVSEGEEKTLHGKTMREAIKQPHLTYPKGRNF